jgi:uncharacterized protein (DUF427 family)
MAKRESLWKQYPDYRLDLEPSDRHVVVLLGGELVVESDHTLVVREGEYDAVVYFPIEDVEPGRLSPTDHQTYCPFKGEASYWTIRAGDRVEENAVWGYKDPFEEVAGLSGHVAFYADRVELDYLD